LITDSQESTILSSSTSNIIGGSNISLIGINSTAFSGFSPGLQIGNGTTNSTTDGNGIGVVAYIKTAGIPQSTGIVIANQFLTSFSDYGEYFEWEDGNKNNEDRRGLFVTFTGSKIKIATKSDYILGIVTQTSGIIGNASEISWHGSIESDKFGQPIMEYNRLYDLRQFVQNMKINPENKSEQELITILKNNGFKWGEFNDPERIRPKIMKTSSNYDGSKVYIPRSKRIEWTTVGLLGQLTILEEIPGTCAPGQSISCSISGKATPGSSYKVIRRISPDTVSILFK